ncbi:MAG: outer membrane beta-barrel protein [candidate division Zixibacteria bacterium]|nr:outer membrane beta-barrel protein [candidate division Zixibacteria bacterium]
MKVITALACVVVALAVSADAVSLEKRHQLGLRLGMWNQVTDTRTEIGVGGVETSVEGSGMLGGIAYGHWPEEYLAMTFSIGAMALDITTNTAVSGVTEETSVIASMLMGVKYYPLRSTLSSSVRPYLKSAVGSFIGTQSSRIVGLTVVTESRTEFAFGGQLGAGMDFVTGRHFMMGFGLAYNLMTDFSEPIGGSKNYGGPEFAFEFSWLFGKGLQ